MNILQDATDPKYERIPHPGWSPQHRPYQQPPASIPYHSRTPQQNPHGSYPQLQPRTVPNPLNGSLSALHPGARVTPSIDFEEVWQFFMRQDMSHVKVGNL